MTSKKIKSVLKSVFVKNVELKIASIVLTLLTFIVINF